MSKVYAKPELRHQTIQLGVFGNYNDDGGQGGGGNVNPTPIRIVEGFQMHMD